MQITAFRTATLNDVAPLTQLVNSAYHPGPDMTTWTNESRFVLGTRTSEQSLEKLLVKDDSVVLLGLHDDLIVASVHVEKSENHAHIGMLAVNPVWQCNGLGKQMLTQAEAYAGRYFNVEKCVLVVIELRDELIAFYQRRGYRKTGRTIDYAALCGDTCDGKIDGMQLIVLEKCVF